MKAIIFDCDGVLVDSEIIYKEVELAYLAEIGLIYEAKEFTRRFMGMTGERWYAEITDDYTSQFAKPFPTDFRTRLKSHLLREFETRLTAVREIDTILTNVTSLPKAVASSSELDYLHRKLKKTELHSYFGEHIYSGEQVEHGKPAPDLFLFTAANLNIPAEECCVIEDSRNGVIAGKAANMHVIGFCGGSHCDEEHAQSLYDAGADHVAMTVGDLDAYLSARKT